uniref:Uncharacterized protein n=1 Tax=Anopheles atroparvus TaxID=41427 RepID=A0AAG5D9I0_ANOAO
MVRAVTRASRLLRDLSISAVVTVGNRIVRAHRHPVGFGSGVLCQAVKHIS